MFNIFAYLRIKLASPQKRAAIYSKSGIKMGKNCEVFHNVSFGSEPYLITLGDNVKITANCSFITHDGGVYVLRNLYKESANIDVFGEITIGNNVFIGNNCIILPDTKIGDNVIIGAGSIVSKDIPAYSVAAGVPAKIIRSLNEYYDNVLDKADYTKNMTLNEKRKYLADKYKVKEEL